MASKKQELNYFKTQFRHLNFYSLPNSILFVLRKRLNFVTTLIFVLALGTYSIF